MRGLRSTLALLVVFVGLGAYIYFVESKRSPTSEADGTEKVFAFQPSDVSELRVTAAGGETTTLTRSDEEWDIVDPITADADATQTSAIASGLSSLELQRVVEEAPADLDAFGLASPRVDVAFKLADEQDFQHLLIGERTPTGGDLYAKTSAGDRVFLIASYLESTFNRGTWDLRDKSVLTFDRGTVESVEIETAGRRVRLAKRDDEWVLTEPLEARAEYGTVEGLIGQLASAEMQSIAEENAADLSAYGLTRPEITATIAAGSARATLQVGSESEGRRYARDASRPIVFTIDTTLVTELQTTPADFRRKDLFGFRPFNATRLDITHEGTARVFEKTAPATEGAEATWRQTSPDARDIDRAKMEDLLGKLSNLRAESFVDSRAGTNLDAPLLTVVARYEDGDTEDHVRFARAGDETYAVAGDEPGAGRVNTRAVDDALDALKAVE